MTRLWPQPWRATYAANVYSRSILEVPAPRHPLQTRKFLLSAEAWILLLRTSIVAVLPSSPFVPTVLVIDDEDGPREALRLVLKPHCRVLAATGGEEALDILAREKVDVITLDLRMPGLDGVATLERIREIDPEVAVVIVTGFGSKETVTETIFLGAFSYLNKPFHATDLLDTIRQALTNRRLPGTRGA